MGNLLQMSITSGQDTDSRQFTLAASSHRLAGETYDANGNRTSGTADGFTSVAYNILNLPETVTAGGRTINYLYSARWSTPDPLSEKYYSISPYAYCAANPVNIVDPSGRNWYSYTDSTGTTQYKYVEGQMSKAELKNGKYKDLGYTYCDNNTNTYYSLFGKILPYSSDLEFTLLGHFYEIIDQLIIAHCKYVIDNEKYYRFGGEDLTEPSIDYSINGLRAGSYNFSYNGLTFSSEKRGTIFRAIEQNGVVFRGLRIIGDRYVKTTLFPTYETTRAGLNQNPLIDSGWKGYFIVAQPRSGKSFDSIQILFDKQNATSFLKSCNMLFGTDF
ncbi:MAG: hypothetical protein K6E44_03805 [Bacteroidales bacterium]|nr:hypothetical protein [Bacteroidales bacterium]